MKFAILALVVAILLAACATLPSVSAPIITPNVPSGYAVHVEKIGQTTEITLLIPDSTSKEQDITVITGILRQTNPSGGFVRLFICMDSMSPIVDTRDVSCQYVYVFGLQ